MLVLWLDQRKVAVWAFNRTISTIKSNHLKNQNPLGSQAEICPQSKALFPSKSVEIWKELDEVFKGPDFVPKAAELLGGAVRIP